jgi:tartrate-resistant acid phosphatase type 5
MIRKNSSQFSIVIVTWMLLVSLAFGALASCNNEVLPTATFLESTLSPSVESTLIETAPDRTTPIPSITWTPAPLTPTFPLPTISLSRTATNTPIPPVVFAVIGDYGEAGTAEADVAALINSWNVDFIITTGDNNYSSGAAKTIDKNIGQYYHQYIFPYYGDYGSGAETNRFFPSLGNHDWIANNAQPYLDYFTLPGNERYYEFIWGNAHFFALDSDTSEPDGVGKSSDQAQWLQTRMEQSSLPLKFVYFHHAPYSSSSYHGSTGWMQWPFQEWGATAVFSGHDHVYERLEITGIPYFIVGLSGNTSRYQFGEPLMESLYRYRDDFGALKVTIEQDYIIYEFITRHGEVIDTLRWFIGR